MKRILKTVTALSAATFMLLAVHTPASAQAKDINSALSQGKTILRGASDSFVDIILILVGLAGVVMVLPNLIKQSKGDPSASDSFIRLGTSLIAAFVIIQFCRLVF